MPHATDMYVFFSIYLIDHAWTYRADQARQQLESVPKLLSRMANLMDLTTDGKDGQVLIEEVLTEMWKYVLSKSCY